MILKSLVQCLNFCLLLLLGSCTYDKNNVDIGSLFDPTWDFSNPAQFNFNGNYIDFKEGEAQLKPVDLTDEGSDFDLGISLGTTTSTSTSSLSLKSNVDDIDIRGLLPQRVSRMVGYWKFDSDLITDALSLNSDLTTAQGAPTLMEGGRVGGAARFDGDDELEGTGTSILDFNEASFSVSLWINTIDSGNQKYLNKRTNSEGFANAGLGWDVGINSGLVSLYTNSGTAYEFAGSPGRIDDGLWHHIVVMYDHENSEKRYYIDGQLTITTATTAFAATNSEPLNFGHWRTTSFANGMMDEVALFDVALTQEDVTKIYQGQKKQIASQTQLNISWTPHWSEIVGYWPLDENAQDFSGNSFHGTLVADALFDSSNFQVGHSSIGLDGSGDSIEVPDAVGLDDDFAGGLTLLAWVNFAESGFSGNQDIIAKACHDGGSWTDVSFYIDKPSSNKPSFVLSTDGSTLSSLIGNKVFSSERWHHIAATYNGSQQRLYVDGVLDSSQNFSGGIFNSTSTFTISGREVGGGCAARTQHLGGHIDEVAIFKKDLSATDIHFIYHRQKQKYSGVYDSKVFALGSASSEWPSLGWSTTLPFGKELVGDFDGDGNSDPESASEYSLLASQLNNDLIGYWPLNEPSGTSGAGSVKGQSTYHINGTTQGSVTFGEVAPFKTGGTFNGSTDYIELDDANLDVSVTGSFSQSLWLNSRVKDTAYHALLSYNGDGVAERPPSIFINTKTSIGTWFGEGVSQCGFQKANVIKSGQWHHIVTTFDGTDYKLYVDGVEMHTTSSCSSFSPVSQSKLWIGAAAGVFFDGHLDEVAMWKRALLPGEVVELYRRGAHRVKLQVKSCVDAACECKSFSSFPQGSANDCDGDGTLNAADLDDIYKSQFLGPGGSEMTSYSEFFNRMGTDLNFNCGVNSSDSDSSVCVSDETTLVSSPRPSAPTINYTNFLLAARPSDNPYFQYRVLLESENKTVCSGSICSPELQSASLNFLEDSRYFAGVQEVEALNPASYKNTLSLDIDADECVTFQVSPDGSNYYYLNSGVWSIVSSQDHRTNQTDLKQNIGLFAKKFGPGSLYLKAFLQTNASQTLGCSLRKIDVN